MTVRVKVCGMTRAADAALACELGAAAIGFVFWPRSPRYVAPSRAREIAAGLPAHVMPIGVFVNPDESEVRSVAEEVGLGAVQLHGDETVALCEQLPYPVFKAVPLSDAASVETACRLPDTVTVLLDVHDPVARGGTGRTIDWALAAQASRRRRVFLAGGLTAANVGAALRTVRPYGVDVSSGLEMAPGVKDPMAMRAFFRALPAKAVPVDGRTGGVA